MTRSLAAVLALISLAACSPGEEPSLVSQAHASSAPSGYDYGWRTPMGESAVADGSVFDYQ